MSDSDSSSDEEEIQEHEADAAAALKSGKLKVPNGDGTFRCPFCVSKKKQDYKYHELLAHATGQGKSIRGNLVMGGQHRALATFLETELKHFAEPAAPRFVKLEQATPQRKQADHMVVHPWVGLVYNIGTVESGGKRTSAGAGELKERFREYCPDQVKSFWDFRGSLGVAAITFNPDMLGYGHCRAFETGFLSAHHGKNNWLKNKKAGCLGTELYGWMATEEDYNENGKVGEYLRGRCNLKTMNELEDDRMRTHEHLRNQLIHTIAAQSELLAHADTENFGLRSRMEAAEQARKRADLERQILEDKHRMELEDVRAESQRMQEMHQLEMKQRAADLEAEMKSLQEQLNIRASDNHEAEIKRLENERRIEEISKEMEMRTKQHDSSMSMLEKHENEMQKLAKEIQEKQLSLAKQQMLEVTILQLQEKLETERLKEPHADQSSETIKRLETQLRDLEEERDSAQDLVNQIAMMHRSTNDIVAATRKAAVKALAKHGSETAVGIRRMGEIDSMWWEEAFRDKFPNSNWQLKMSKSVSFWEERIKKHDWFPYKNETVDNKLVQVVNADEPELKKLREQFGDKVYGSVASALLGISQYNPSGRYPVPTPWNFATSQEASLADAVTHLETVASEHKAAVAAADKTIKGLEEEVKNLRAALVALEQSLDPATTSGKGKRKLR